MTKNILVIHSINDIHWQKSVDTHLRVLRLNNPVEIEYWDETSFSQSKDINDIFEPLLSRTSAIVLLMSKSFLDSGIMKTEAIRTRLKMKQEGGFPIFNVIIDRCEWKKYRWMKNLRVFPVGEQLLSDLDEGGRERTLADLATGVLDALSLKTLVTEGILGYIELNGVGHIDTLTFEPANRLNIITGDNGYGKTLLLECIWWALSGKWSQFPVFPNDNFNEATIAFKLMQNNGNQSVREEIRFDFEKQEWPENIKCPNLSGLVVYARSDGSFAVWDPVKGKQSPPPGYKLKKSPLVFSKWEVFKGKYEKSEDKPERQICNGMIVDWINWQNSSSSHFILLREIIQILSLYSGESLEPSDPVNVTVDSHIMPTIKYPYGNVPIIYAASSVQRIISLAYLLVWMWSEHQTTCEKTKTSPYRNLILLLDEAESHLHPKWQRSLIPSLLEIKKFFSKELNIQFIISTHSPLLMASLEPEFDEMSDSIFHIQMKDNKIQLNPQPFLRHGRVDYWFTSDSFELKYARSVDAENAIKEAIEIQKSDRPDSEKVKQIHVELCRVLGEFDTFWPRWSYFARQHGARDDSC